MSATTHARQSAGATSFWLVTDALRAHVAHTSTVQTGTRTTSMLTTLITTHTFQPNATIMSKSPQASLSSLMICLCATIHIA